MTTTLTHWRFFRAGGFDQVRLDTAAELLNIGSLDQKLWVALSCPVKGIEFGLITQNSCSAVGLEIINPARVQSLVGGLIGRKLSSGAGCEQGTLGTIAR